MDRIALASDNERRKLFMDVSDKLGSTDFIIEKDFWVSWILEKIFTDKYLSEILCFKGGTSLSKAFHLIERFSEDVDLILSQEIVLKDGEKLAQPSKTKQSAFNKEIENRAVCYITTELKEKIAEALGNVCSVFEDKEDGHVLYVQFPHLFSYAYIKPDIKLEIGPLALWDPNEKYPVSSYVADLYPELGLKSAIVPTIKAERTFWEKITILHHEHYRPESSPLQSRYSRHYYDIFKMGHSEVRSRAMANMELLTGVVEFKKWFYPRGWAKYEEAVPGTLRLYPAEYNLSALKKDYAEMQYMIFGDIPEWNEILKYLKELEAELNI
jgi:hypothetical protein